MLTTTFAEPNMQSDTDKLNKTVSYILFLFFESSKISVKFNITINTPKDNSIDFFISLSQLHPLTGVACESVKMIMVFNNAAEFVNN